jgi:hypothetical protein
MITGKKGYWDAEEFVKGLYTFASIPRDYYIFSISKSILSVIMASSAAE